MESSSFGGALTEPADEADPRGGIVAVVAAVAALRAELLARSVGSAAELAGVHDAHRLDAENLLHYLELRGHDVRELQVRLADLGLSSLGRSEGHVLATVDAVLTALRALAASGQRVTSSAATRAEVRPGAPDGGARGLTFAQGRRLLAANAEALLGQPRTGRRTRIMVTLPGAAADDYPLVRALVERGMDCARINCAHDDTAAWARIVDHVRAATREIGQPCLVAMDLAGPKLRTGPITPGAQVVRLSPRRDPYGRVTVPAACWLVDEDAPNARSDESAVEGIDQARQRLRPDMDRSTGIPAGDLAVPVSRDFLAELRSGDQIFLRDTRGARRCLRVTAVMAPGTRAEADQTTYLATGTPLRVRRDHSHGSAMPSTHVGGLPPREQSLRLRVNDRLILARDLSPTEPPDPGGVARIGCTLPEVFGHVRPGHQVWFDDGKIGAVVTAVRPTEIDLDITDAPPAGARLRGEKGINLPDTDLPVPALTAKDRADLAFVAAHADIVSLSFVRRGEVRGVPFRDHEPSSPSAFTPHPLQQSLCVNPEPQ